MAWMNIEMDMATNQKVDSTMPYSGPWKMSGEPWSCKIEGQKLVRNIERQLWEHMQPYSPNHGCQENQRQRGSPRVLQNNQICSMFLLVEYLTNVKFLPKLG